MAWARRSSSRKNLVLFASSIAGHFGEGALVVLEIKENPDRFSQSAHSLREVTDVISHEVIKYIMVSLHIMVSLQMKKFQRKAYKLSLSSFKYMTRFEKHADRAASDKFKEMQETEGMRPNVILALFLSIMLVCITSLVAFSVDVQEAATRNYILSSISQGLAAVFALIFTITLILSQILGALIPERMRRIFYISYGIILLMFLFAVGIITPLLVMQSQSELLLDLCIILSSVCISSLIPYFVHVGNKWSHSTISSIASDEIERIANQAIEKIYKMLRETSKTAEKMKKDAEEFEREWKEWAEEERIFKQKIKENSDKLEKNG